MKHVPAVVVRPEVLSPELKAMAANAGVSVRTDARVPRGQVFVYDPDGRVAQATYELFLV